MPHILIHNHAFGVTNDIIKNLGSMNKGKKMEIKKKNCTVILWKGRHTANINERFFFLSKYEARR
jgi:hypothetical protein